MALRGFANTARYMIETDTVGYVWNQRRDGKPTPENLRVVVCNMILKSDPIYQPKEWARIIDQRDGIEVCWIAVDASCQPTEWAKDYWRKYGGTRR